MIPGLPELPAIGVGSYAVPGWFIVAQRQAREGVLGPHDMEEATNDAVRVVVQDQIEAGFDVISDGEVRRQRFVYEMFQHMEGLTRVPATRRLGIAGYDQAPGFVAGERIAAPDGLGLGAELAFLKDIAAGRPVKMALPGPLTFAMRIDPGPRDAAVVLDEIVAILTAEIRALAAAGADIFQLDEPALPHPPLGLTHAEAAAAINRVLAAFDGYRAVHVCFGNNAGRPFADRRFGRLMDAMTALDADQLVLEFANREMAEVELLADLQESFEIAAGVVDVKNFHLETPEDVARRLETVLRHVPMARLSATSDCGFSALPRYIARQKASVLVAGARLLRGD
ncbi:cobalamin-independent methionine synthase II family protein [Minwuia thermotolerans]|uniref:Methionine synthase n=1 Tax=Minwuia thermotolerans TaxID=2056226 RepID=A0A2M9G710_9PROT|nr:cobalamin-independent methionine synthase II family protein [Minwuia thermotolerans]PJK31481.1 methionine synthase [Minwuia thermotolerans]